MLGEAASRHRPPTADQVLADPRYAMYLAGWPRQGDYGLVAEHDEPLGAAWYRTYTAADHGFGFVSADVPELSIAVVAPRRREGIGRRLDLATMTGNVAQVSWMMRSGRTRSPRSIVCCAPEAGLSSRADGRSGRRGGSGIPPSPSSVWRSMASVS
jgi:hypothetical protein